MVMMTMAMMMAMMMLTMVALMLNDDADDLSLSIYIFRIMMMKMRIVIIILRAAPLCDCPHDDVAARAASHFNPLPAPWLFRLVCCLLGRELGPALHCRRPGLVLSHSQHKVFVSARDLSPREPDRGGDNDQKAQIESCSQSGCHNQPDCNCQCVKDWNFKDLGFFINSKYAASHE